MRQRKLLLDFSKTVLLTPSFSEILACEPSDELQESLEPSGPEIPKKSEKSLPGPKKSRKSPEQTFSRLFPDFSGFFETFPDFSDFFETFSRLFGTPGPEGTRDSCSSREGSQILAPSRTLLRDYRCDTTNRARQANDSPTEWDHLPCVSCFAQAHQCDAPFRNISRDPRMISKNRVPKPTQNPEIPKNTPRSHELFRKVRANICLLPCDTSQEPNGNCSEILVQMNCFILGGFFRMDFPPLKE